jgi:hypothetical protein
MVLSASRLQRGVRSCLACSRSWNSLAVTTVFHLGILHARTLGVRSVGRCFEGSQDVTVLIEVTAQMMLLSGTDLQVTVSSMFHFVCLAGAGGVAGISREGALRWRISVEMHFEDTVVYAVL